MPRDERSPLLLHQRMELWRIAFRFSACFSKTLVSLAEAIDRRADNNLHNLGDFNGSFNGWLLNRFGLLDNFPASKSASSWHSYSLNPRPPFLMGMGDTYESVALMPYCHKP